MIRIPACVAMALAPLLGGCWEVDDNKSTCNIDSVLPENDGTPPRDRLDLNHWQLTLPVDNDGGTAGQARTVSAAELLAGYASEWFYGGDDGGVSFWAPVNGAKTPNSRYARSELREVINPDDVSQNWNTTGIGEMNASLAVAQVPFANDRVTVGKIVGYGDATEVTALLHLVYRLHDDSCRASLYALLSDAPTKGAPTRTLTLHDRRLRMNEEFTYKIRVANNTLTLASGTEALETTIDPSWSATPVYFRAGAGLGAAGDSSVDGAHVTFYALSVTH